MWQDHEALSGDVLYQIRNRLQVALGYNANIVIINGGTNNANLEDEPDRQYIHDEMDGILTDIWNRPETADTCIILSTLLPTTHEFGARHRIPINEEYRKLVQEHEDDKCIYLADMEPEGEGKDFLSTEEDIWSDEIHPNVSLPASMASEVVEGHLLSPFRAERGAQANGLRVLRGDSKGPQGRQGPSGRPYRRQV